MTPIAFIIVSLADSKAAGKFDTVAQNNLATEKWRRADFIVVDDKWKAGESNRWD